MNYRWSWLIIAFGKLFKQNESVEEDITELLDDSVDNNKLEKNW